MSKLTTASVLAFERNLDISDAYFMQKNSNEKEVSPIIIKEKSVRGTISNRLKNTIANDPLKLDAEVQKANLQTVDVANLDTDKDTLIAHFSLKILPFTGKPCVCNKQEYQDKLEKTVQSYVEKIGFAELAKRYAINILNARWLWRNRVGAEKISITIKNKEASLSIENALDYSLNDFTINNPDIEKISHWIVQGLEGKAFTLLEITAHATMGKGQEVFPSQELILDKGSSKKSKFLYEVDGKAGMHSQKIGNAIRTIDTWYSDDAKFPIAIEPYGAVTTMGTAFRQPKQKNDFYTLFDNWILKDENRSIDEQHYIIAILIRGGVFGEAGKE